MPLFALDEKFNVIELVVVACFVPLSRVQMYSVAPETGGMLYTTPFCPGQTELLPVMLPGVSVEQVLLATSIEDAGPAQVPFSPDTEIVPPAKLDAKLMYTEFVFDPDQIEAPKGNTHR